MDELQPGDDSAQTGALLLIDNESGTLAVGDHAEIERWVASANIVESSVKPVPALPPSLLGNASNLLGAAREISQVLITQSNRVVAASSELRLVTRDLSTGQFISNVAVDPRTLMMGAGPHGVMVYASLQAIQMVLEEITEAIMDVAVDVKELLNFAQAEHLGDVYGHRRVLKHHLGEYQKHGVLITTDWESLAALGPQLETGIEKLRQYLLLEFQDLNLSDSPSKRADKLQKKLKNGRWVGTFKLLLAAQDSLATWQQLRLVRIADQEHHYLGAAIDSTRAILNGHIEEDQVLAARIQEILDDYCVISANEVFVQGLGTKKKLDATGKELEATTQDFLRYRGIQAEEWGLHDHAQLNDGIRHVQRVADGAQRGIRNSFSRGLKFIATRIEADDDRPADDKAVADSDDK